MENDRKFIKEFQNVQIINKNTCLGTFIIYEVSYGEICILYANQSVYCT